MASRPSMTALLSRLSQAVNTHRSHAQTLCALRRTTHRELHTRVAAPPVPKPTPFVPDVSTFLTLIGRNLSQHASKIESWDTLFRLTSPQLRDLGIEPPRTRKYLLRWRDKFRHGEFGIGGDAKFVGEGGAVECRVVEVPVANSEADAAAVASLTASPGMRKTILNVPWTDPLGEKEDTTGNEKPADAENESAPAPDGGEAASSTQTQRPRRPSPLDGTAIRRAQPIKGVHYKPGQGIRGQHVRVVRGSQGQIGIIAVQEGIWEHRRGQKIDGGERRKAEVRFKRRSAERRAARK